MTIIQSGARSITTGHIVRRALRLIRAIGEGETPTAQEYTDALEAMNSMLDSWRNDRLMVYAVQSVDFTLTGASSYSIGPGQTFNAVTPILVQSAGFTLAGHDYGVDVVGAEQYGEITEKALIADYPRVVYYEAGAPNGLVYIWPVPSSGTLSLDLYVPFANYTNPADAVILPAGYERAIAYNLAIEIAPEYGKEPSVAVAAIAKESKRQIESTNSPLPIAHMEIHSMHSRSAYDIQRGW